MKIRTDYVSNSSSSSFVLAQNEIFEFFNITKRDIMDALLEAYGRSSYNEEVASVAKSVAEHPEWHEDDIKFGSFGPIWVYDLLDKSDRWEAIERWGGLLKEWDATNCHYEKRGDGKLEIVAEDDLATCCVLRRNDIDCSVCIVVENSGSCELFCKVSSDNFSSVSTYNGIHRCGNCVVHC